MVDICFVTCPSLESRNDVFYGPELERAMPDSFLRLVGSIGEPIICLLVLRLAAGG